MNWPVTLIDILVGYAIEQFAGIYEAQPWASAIYYSESGRPIGETAFVHFTYPPNGSDEDYIPILNLHVVVYGEETFKFKLTPFSEHKPGYSFYEPHIPLADPTSLDQYIASLAKWSHAESARIIPAV